MKLVAMMVVHNEADRYLIPCLDHLVEFCDEIRVLNDGSTDDTFEILDRYDPVIHMGTPESNFFGHEGNTRQALLEWTMQGQPTHVLAIDADEFIADGELLRAMMEEGSATGVWKLRMTEVWGAWLDWLDVRQDGDWKPRPIGVAFEVPTDLYENRQIRRHWRINDRALACGRTPLQITMAGNRTTTDPVTDILHFGWACKADRATRYARYVEHDGGQHHANKHLLSIMWDDEQVETSLLRWPPALDKEALMRRANRT